MNYVIFDLEWNRFVKAVKSRCPDEIIQIGAVKYNSQMTCIGSFNKLVKPVLYKKIDPMVKKLTGLDMTVLNSSGVPFSKVIKEFKKFVGDDAVIMSWGSQDVKILRSNCVYFNPDIKLEFLKKYADVQRYVTHILSKNSSGGNQLGVKLAADMSGIKYNEKNLHNALVDADISGQVFAKLFNQETLKKYIVDASVKSGAFNDIPITDIDNKLIDKRIFKIRCPECGRYIRRKNGWQLNGNKFLSAHICRKCKVQYLCSVEIVKSYGNIIKYKKRIRKIK